MKNLKDSANTFSVRTPFHRQDLILIFREMVEHLHQTFLSSHANYEAAVDFGKSLCLQTLRSTGEIALWKPCRSFSFADGTPFLDGNPIYSLRCDSLRRGLRIIQFAPTHHDVQIDAWIEVQDCEHGDSIDELVIACELSAESLAIARRLIEQIGASCH